MNTLNPPNNLAARPAVGRFLSLFLLALLAGVHEAAGLAATNTPAAIPWNQIGAKAGANYQGDGLAVTPNGEGARLHCVFQRLDGEATPEGLWLTSTVTNTPSDRFRVTAMAVGRVTPCAPGGDGQNIQHSTSNIQLEDAGIITLAGQTVRFTRPGLMEEYSVSMDGVRQDFVVPERPAGAGELTVRLAVSGARVEPAAAGARLVLDNSGRKLAYSRLRVTDATGKELPARIEVAGSPLPAAMGGDRDSGAHGVTCPTLVVVVNDAAAVYPVRIDPTFSDANWISMGRDQGVNDYVGAMAVDGAGNVYIGGEFTTVNDIIVNGIAKWDGSSWSALGSGIRGDYASVYALAVSGSNLYVGGYFTNAGGIAATNIAKWDGNSWSALGSGISGESSDEYYGAGVFALAVSSGTLYAGGNFTTAGGVAANYIAQWNGSSWSPLGLGMGGGSYPYVNALAVSGSTLFVGGYFTTAGGIAANYIAQWDGSSWSALGSGISGGDQAGPYVSALAVSGGTLYAGGDFTYAGDVAASDLAQWDGSSWSALGSGISGQTPDGYGPYVNALAVLGGTLYVGGDFSTVGGVAANDLAQWDGSSWSALGWALNYEVSVLAVSGSTLYASGESYFGSGNAVTCIAQWNGSSWSALDPGTGTFSGGDGQAIYLNALAVSGSTVYVGGDFSTAGGSPANFVAQWNGSSWSPLGSGMDYPVLALAVSGSTLFAGGYFMTAGGNPANAIAQWDGSSWSALGSGISGYDLYDYFYFVDALAVSDGTLYAGGFFETADDYPANNIAQWDGNSWSPLGSGMDGVPYALAVSGGTLYAGGVFDTADGVPAANIAQWDGNNWSALGSGMEIGYGYNPQVNALALSGSTLYAGGYFTNAGGNAADNIAQWDGNNWSALSSGMSGAGYDGNGPYVDALAVSGGTLYVGGDFTAAGGNLANCIAQWNGSSWSALGSGISGISPDGGGPYVGALAVSGSDLYVEGDFDMAGGKESDFIARAYLLALPTLSVSPYSLPQGGVTVSWPSADTAGFTLLQASTPNIPASWFTNIASITDDGTTKSVTLPATNSAQFFRLRAP